MFSIYGRLYLRFHDTIYSKINMKISLLSIINSTFVAT